MNRLLLILSIIFCLSPLSYAKSKNVIFTKNKKEQTGQGASGDKAPSRPWSIPVDYDEQSRSLSVFSPFETATVYLMDDNYGILDCAPATNASFTVPDGYDYVIICIDSESWYAIGHIEL